MIHLDTSFLIRALVRRSAEDRRLREWLRAGEACGISCIAWTEFQCGPLESRDLDLASRLLPDPEPFVPDDARLAASLFNLAGRPRATLLDCMIAATAIRAEAGLATANPDDVRVLAAAGLRIVTAGRSG